MAAVSVPGQEPWVVARWAFRRLVEQTSARLVDPDDLLLVRQAVALDGLHYDLLEPERAGRIARAMRTACACLRRELLREQSADPRDVELAEALTVLELRLGEVG